MSDDRDHVYVDTGDQPETITTYTPPCAECERLRSDLAQERDYRGERDIKFAEVVAERDALERRWNEMRQWFHTPMGTETAVERHMRELEQR